MKTFNITVNGTPYSVTVEETNGAAPWRLQRLLPQAAPAAALRRRACRGPAARRPQLRLPPLPVRCCFPRPCPAPFWM